MFSKTPLIKTLAIALGLNVAAAAASANCVLVAADGSFITLPRGGCFYGATEQDFVNLGGLGCEGAAQVFYVPEFNDRTVALVETDARSGWSALPDLHTNVGAFGGGAIIREGDPRPQIRSHEFQDVQRENISAFKC